MYMMRFLRFVFYFVRARQEMVTATSAAYTATSQEYGAAGSCGFVLPIDLDKEGRRVSSCEGESIMATVTLRCGVLG